MKHAGNTGYVPMLGWMVWVQSADAAGGMSYIYPFGYIAAETGEEAIDYVLTRYCATRDGRRFLNDPLTVLSKAWAAPMEHLIEVRLEAINQPQYQRVEA